MKIFILIFFQFALSQSLEDSNIDYKTSSERFFMDTDGSVKMFVNVWGHVNRPGLQTVYDGIDIATLLSIVGGPKSGADLKFVKVFRESPDKNGKQSYTVNLEEFLVNGNRDSFVKIYPNDTVIVQEKFSSYVLSRLGIVNVILSTVNIYIQLLRINS